MGIQNLSILGGCGHIGLPLGILCAREGFNTTLIDSDRERVEKVSQGELPFYEKGAAPLLKEVMDSGKLLATMDWEEIKKSEVVMITTPGSLPSDDGGIDTSFIFFIMEQLCPILRSDQIVLLRSTLAPGISEKIFHFIKGKKEGVSVGYCPERILQGEALSEMQRQPQIISGFDEKALAAARFIFSRLTRSSVIELSPQEAELAKIFCNVWRYINFSISNQFWEIAEEAGCDFTRIRQAATMDYPRMSQFGTAGFVGGACLKKDVLQLAAQVKESAFLGQAAMEINEGMISFVGRQLTSRFGRCDGVRVGVLGLTFKKDSDDLRNSLSLKLVAHLENLGAVVKAHDPFVPSASLEEALDAPAVVVATPHTAFQNLLFKEGTFVINPWR